MKLSPDAAKIFKSASIEAVVLNADGTVKKRLGVVSEWHRNPLVRAWTNVRRAMRARFKRG